MALLAASQGACSGGSAAAGDAAAGVDGAPGLDAAHPGDFISADVDGVPVRAELTPTAGTKGLAYGLIWVVAGKTSAADGWNLYILNNVGTNDCPTNWIALFQSGPTLRSDNPGASCSVTVTAAAPALGDVIEGAFNATLTAVPEPPATVGAAHAVTNGAFHVTRTFE